MSETVEDQALKHCTYCGRGHGRRGRACSDYCERKTRGWKSSATGGRTRALKRLLAAQQKRVLHRTRWRDVTMGRDADANLLRIFNVSELPPCQD